ncbi:hypothetical protein K7432_016695, partial [Basidiobolus ranarum]
MPASATPNHLRSIVRDTQISDGKWVPKSSHITLTGDVNSFGQHFIQASYTDKDGKTHSGEINR